MRYKPIDSSSSAMKPLFGVLMSRKIWANVPNVAMENVEPHA